MFERSVNAMARGNRYFSGQGKFKGKTKIGKYQATSGGSL